MEFLRELSEALLEFSGCALIRILMTDVDFNYSWTMSAGHPSQARIDPIRWSDTDDIGESESHDLQDQIRALMGRLHDGERKSTTAQRSFHVYDEATRCRLRVAVDAQQPLANLFEPDKDAAILLLPLEGGASQGGLIVLSSPRSGQIRSQDCFLYEQLAETIGRAVLNRRAQFRLQERIKELTCLHGVAKAVQTHGDSFEASVRAIIKLLPDAMQFPAMADASLTLDGRVFSTNAAAVRIHCLAVPIVAGGCSRGTLEVSYREAHPEFAGNPFLREERDLLNSVAHEVAMLIERAESVAAKASMAEQLRHADRLATIGQLAAGVAHELNEPLGNIMGFAQLLQKQAGLPEGAHRDAEQIVQAVLHGREIVKKLLLFSRQSNSQRIRLDLSNLIRENLYFLEARCRHGGIDMRLDFEDGPANIVGVPSEMTQVLVNLAVNAIQAMPAGGALTIRTRATGESVFLAVEDTGTGMDEATQRRLFTPFFTTKDIGEGTGLGLSVVLGIVSAHGGTIHVESAPGRGSRFEIRLPAADSADPNPKIAS